jgi:tetratricopeptide (TPR) repeat protein
VSCVVTIIAQNAGGALRSFTYYPLETRIVNALVCYANYLYQTIWPVNLAVFYPHPKHWPIWSIALSALTVSLISLVALRARKSHPYLLFGWLWYVVSLLPVIGLVQVGGQAHADRYTYVPSIGLFVLIAWSLPGATRIARWGSMAFACVALLALIMPLQFQINHWRNDRSLAEHTLRVTGENEVAHLLLGNVLLDEGNFASAAEHFGAAARLQPNWADAHNNLGNALAHQGETARAVQAYRRAIEIQPELADVHYNLGVVLHRDKKLDDGLHELELAIALDPRHQAAFIQLGATLRDLGRLVEAAERFETAVALRPNDPVALINLADAQAKLGQRDRAVENFRKTAEIAESMGDGSLHKQALDRLAELGAKSR